jgi:hypothetical protein
MLEERESFADLARRSCRYAGWAVFEGQKIRFIRPQPPVDVEVPPGDLLHKGDRTLTTTRVEEGQTPKELALSYIDQARDFPYNTARARRIQYPTQSTRSRRKDAFAVPFVIPADEALTRTAQAMFREAVEAVQHSFTLPAQYLYLEPGDILQIEFTTTDSEDVTTTTTHIVKINRVEIGPDFTIGVEAANLWTDEDI